MDMNCPACGATIGSLDGPCVQCGAVFEYRCDTCERHSPTGVSFCAGCGSRLTTLCAVEPEQPGEAPAPAQSDLGLGGRLGGQRRTVTILMSDLSGYTAMGERLDPEEIAQIMGTIKRDATSIVESFGGIVNQFVGDEILALFGLPTTTEDDPRRAVAAALALHERVNELNASVTLALAVPLAMHSGIHTGLLVAEIRDSRNGLYEVFGDAINTTARLLSVAESGEVVVGEPTRAAIAPFFEIESARSHNVRGKAEALQAFRVIGQRTDLTSFDAALKRGLTPFAGRSEETTRLHALLDRAREGDAQVVIVEGEAGSGKSRLCFEFVDAARRSTPGLITLKGRCQSYGATTPYLPFLQVIRDVMGIGHDDDVLATVDAVSHAVGEMDSRVKRFVPAYLYLLSASSVDALPGEWQGEALPDVLQQSIVELILAVSQERPAIIQLDDWHWADEASETTLARLCRAIGGTHAMVLVTQRPNKSGRDELAAAQRLELHSLSRSATEQMIGACVGAESVQSEIVTAIYERTLGNPFFVEEVCAAIQNQGSARVASGELLYVEGGKDFAIPETVQAVVRSRVDSLSGPLQETLRVASVVGREFGVDILGRLTNSSTTQTMLEGLEQLGFVERMPLSTDSRFRFRHIITQEVTYDALLMRERKAVHARIADIIEESQSDEDKRQLRDVEALAYHYQRAGNSIKALGYLELAADKAFARRALAEARHQFRSAIDETLGLEQSREVRATRAQLTLRWANAAVFLPSMNQIALLEAAMRESLEDGDLVTAVLASYWINWILYSLGNQTAAEDGTRKLLAQVEMAGAEPTVAMLQCHLGQILGTQRRLSESEFFLEEGLRQLTRLATVSDELDLSRIDGMFCYVTAQLALTYADRGSFERSEELMQRALRLVRQLGDRSTEASILTTAAIQASYFGDWRRMKASIDAIDSVPEPSVSPFVRMLAEVLGGYAAYRMAANDRSLQQLRRAVVRHEASEARLALCLTRGLLADCLFRAGNIEEAVDVANRALGERDAGDRVGEDTAAYVLLRASGASGAALEERIERLRSEARERGSLRSAALLDVVAGQAHLLVDEFGPAGLRADAAMAATTALKMIGFHVEAEVIQRQARSRR